MGCCNSLPQHSGVRDEIIEIERMAFNSNNNLNKQDIKMNESDNYSNTTKPFL